MKSGLIYAQNLKKEFNVSYKSRNLDKIRESLKVVKDFLVKFEREIGKVRKFKIIFFPC